MRPLDHYGQASWCGGVVFLGGGIGLFALAATPLIDGVPNVVWCLEGPAAVGVPRWLTFWSLLIACFALIVTAGELTRWGYRRWVAARCQSCGAESAYWRESHPIVYVCRACGHRHETGYHDGDENGKWRHG